MNNIYVSKTNNPYINLANEQTLFDNFQDGVTIYLWVNSPCIFIGRSQNPLQEIDMESMENDNIALLRRKSGGGAVYHDLGNINFTFIVKENDYCEDDIVGQVVQILASLGIIIEKNGRNDLIFDGCKISGTASYFNNNKALLHGTILVNVDLDKLSKYLKPKKIKLQSKGISSVKSRVRNLCEIKDITVKDIENAFLNFYQSYTEQDLFEVLSKKTLQEVSDKKYIYSDCPMFDIVYDFIYKEAVCSLSLEVKDGKIHNVTVFTDALNEPNFTFLINNLENDFYSDEKIKKILTELNL